MDFTGKYIELTYQKVLHIDSGSYVYDGTGSFVSPVISGSFTVIGDMFVTNGSVYINSDSSTIHNITGSVRLTGSLDMADSPITNVSYIDFDLTNGWAHEEGRLHWSDDDGTLEFGMPGGDVVLQIGQEMHFRAKNTTGIQIDNGQAVRITGVSGNRPTVGLADASNPAVAGSIGLATQDIPINQFGYITTAGYVRDLNTNSWAEGARIFVGNSPGELTDVYPTSTERKIFIGIVVMKNPESGSIWVAPINSPYISELSGMCLFNPIDNDVVTYNSSSGLWVSSDITSYTSVSASYENTMSFDNSTRNIYSGSLYGDTKFELINPTLGSDTLIEILYTSESQVVTYDTSSIKLTGGTQQDTTGSTDYFLFTCVNTTAPKYILTILNE